MAWAILQPFLTMLVFTIFFGRLGGFDEKTGGISYPVFVFCALVPWQLFSYALTQSSNSVVAEQRLLTKVDFPRSLFHYPRCSAAWSISASSLILLIKHVIYFQAYPGPAVFCCRCSSCSPSWPPWPSAFGWPPSTPSTATSATPSRS